MEENDQILDDEFHPHKEPGKEELTSNVNTRALIYLVIMIIPGFLYHYIGLSNDQGNNLLIILLSVSVVFPLQCIFLSFILEIFRYFMRKRKFRKTGIKVYYDPFWFQVLEGGFGIWILLSVLVLANLFFNS